MDKSNSTHNILHQESDLHLTWQENSQRIRKYADGRAYVQYTRIHCTVCNCHLGSAVANFSDIFIHPLLKVLICKDCFEFYQSSDFIQDDDGNENYCRWCAQGGTLVCCTKCPKVFCKTCIRNNFNKSKFIEITSNDNWKCFSCDFSQISALRIHCYEFRAYCITQENELSKENTNPFSKFLDYSTCCVSRYKSPRRRRSEENSDNTSNHNMVKMDNFSPNESPLLHIAKTSCNIQKSSSGKRERKIEANSAIRKLFLTDTSRHEKIASNINDTSKFLPKPFTFVSLPSYPEHNPSRNDGLTTNTTSINNQVTHMPSVSSELLPLPSFLYRPGLQTPCQIKVVAAKDFLESSTKEIDKAIRETALVNSTFASAILQLTQMNTSAECLNDHITIYNSLQECLNTSIGSLEQIKGQLSISGNQQKRRGN